MKQVSFIINEETTGKTVGGSKPSNQLSSMTPIIERAKDAPARRFPPRGVFRFNSHEEADEWMTKHTEPRPN